MLTGVFRAGPLSILVMYMLVLMGVVIGAGVGYDADSVGETEIYLENETLVVGDNRTDMSPDFENASNTETYNQAEQTSPTLYLTDRIGGDVPQIIPDSINDPLTDVHQSVVTKAYWGMLGITISTADWTATWTYHNRGWMPMWAMQSATKAAGVIPVGAALLLSYRRVKEVSNK